MDPYKILDEQYQEQLTSLEGSFNQQREQLLNVVREQENMLAERYNLERRYIEQTPMDWKQQRTKVQDLNKKYEMKMLELKQKVAPHFQELDSQKQQATFKLNQGRQTRQVRLQLIDELVQGGMIKDPNAAIRAQAQTLGVNMPIEALRGPSREAQIEDLRGELATVNNMLSRFVTDKEGIPTDYDMTGRAFRGDKVYAEDLAPVTSELASLYPQLQQRQAKLMKDLSTTLTQQQTEQPGLHQFSGPAARVAANRSGTFQGQAAQLVPQQLKPIPAGLVESLAAQGLNRQQSEQWLKDNGYDVKS